MPLKRVTGLYGVIDRIASMAGAALGGRLIAWVGAPGALYADAASFLVCALILGLTAGSPPLVPVADRDPVPYVQKLRRGWDFLRRDVVLVGMSAIVAATNLLDLAWSAVLMPVWGRNSGHGAAGIGVLFAVFSACAALSSMAAARWAERLPRFRTYVIAYLLTGLPRFAVLALGSPLCVCVAVFVIGGLACGFLNPILGAVVFERIPERLVGRVSALNSALCWSLMPLGGLLGGLPAASLGLAPALWVVGTAYLLVTLLSLLVPSFREFDSRPAPEPVRARTSGHSV